MDLSTLAGNAPLKRQLELQAARGGLSHAYIISGPAGSGRHTLARLLAQAMVCTQEAGQIPCRSCPGCRKAAAGIHPDIIYVDGEEKGLSVAQIRALRSDAYIRPNEADRKIYLLEKAQNMNPSAQNAMLKLLEEGPAYAAFLLITDNAAALLPTVRSRCEVLSLAPVPAKEAEAFLRLRHPEGDPERLRQAALRCQGILGRALAELEGKAAGADKVGQAAADLLSCLARGDELSLQAQCVGLEKWDREEILPLLDQLILLLRDALVYSCAGAPACPKDRRETASVTASGLTPKALIKAVSLVEQLREASAFFVGTGHLTGWLCAALSDLRETA